MSVSIVPPRSMTRCFDVSRVDPLLSAELGEAPEDPEQTRFLAEVIDANSRAIMLNRLVAGPTAGGGASALR